MSNAMIKTQSIPMSLTGGSARLPGKVNKAVEAVGHRAVVRATELEARAYVAHVGLTVVATLGNEVDQLSEMSPTAEAGLHMVYGAFVQGVARIVYEA